MNELENLKPEVAAAVRTMRAETGGNRDDAYDVIEAELLRLADVEAGQERAVGDPHHDGACSWRWDGVQLWHRFGTNKWVKTSRIHPTPARIAALHSIMCKTTGMSNDKLDEALRSNIREAMNSGVFKDDTRRIIVDWYNQIDAIIKNQAAEAAQAQAQSSEWVMVPREPTEWMLQAAEDAVDAAAHCESTTDDLSAIAYKAALAAAPQQAAEPVAWPFVESPGEIADRLKQALENGCPLLGAVRQVFIENPPLYTHPQPAQDAKDAKDAARYRWLLIQAHQFSSPEHDGMTYPFRLCLKNGFDLSTAIDAARAKESGR